MFLSKSIGCTAPRVNANVNYELWMMLMCQHMFIICNQCTTVVQDIDSGELCIYLETRDIQEISILNFPKAVLKNKVY